MNDNAKPIRVMATIALALQAFWTLMNFIMRLIPEPFLAMQVAPAEYLDRSDIVRHPLVFIHPVLCMILVAVFYYLLMQQSKQPTAFAPALTILILASTVVMRLISMLLSMFQNLMIRSLYSAAELGTLSMFNAVNGWTALITTPVIPLLAAAAAYNWCRYRNSITAQ